MSIIQDINSTFINYGKYKLAINDYSSNEANITMLLGTPFFHTKHLPLTHSILEDILPQILSNKCFNESNLPFKDEVKDTEIGHLFEHIVLEYLCQIKVKNGFRKASFAGVTHWNWKKDTKGTYHIKIQMNKKDKIFLEKALGKSTNLLDKILISKNPAIKSIN